MGSTFSQASSEERRGLAASRQDPFQPGKAAARKPTSGKDWKTLGRSNSLKFLPDQHEIVLRGEREKSKEEVELLSKSLRVNPNLRRFAPFDESQIAVLVDSAWKHTLEGGEVLMSEGDLNNETLYVVASGSLEITAHMPFEVKVEQDMYYLTRPEEPSNKDMTGEGSPKERPKTKTVRIVGPGAMFGDSSMFYNVPRWATIKATEPTTMWVISQSSFRIMQKEVLAKAMPQKPPEEEQLIADSLRTNTNLQRITPIKSTHIKQLVESAWRVEVEEGKVLMLEGDMNADTAFIISEGLFEFTGSEPFQVVTVGNVSHLFRAAHTGQGTLESHGDATTIGEFGRGMIFGEISMAYCAQRFCTVKALQKSAVWAIDRASFQMVQLKAAEDEILDRVEHFKKLETFQSFTDKDKMVFVRVMDMRRFKQGELLVGKDEGDTAMFMLCKGTVSKQKGDGPAEELTADITEGVVHIFGEHNLLDEKEDVVTTVKMTSDWGSAFVLERMEFELMCDRLLESRPSPAFERYCTSATKAGVDDGSDFSHASLKHLGRIGASELGPVELYRHKATRELYVMKVMYKGLVVQKGLRGSLQRERDLMKEMISPFIVKIKATYNQPESVDFLLEATMAGVLTHTYNHYNFYGSVKHAQFYTAGVVLALEHLHKRRIIYRNIKPDNVGITHRGYPKITDMGLAKFVVGHTYTVCGTPPYMAPELVAGVGHNRAVDWWALGVFIYELMTGGTPFGSDLPMEVYSLVMRGIARVDMPAACQGPAEHLIKALIQPAGFDRLGMLPRGNLHVIEHPWFEGFEWKSMRDETMEPPYAPQWTIPARDWRDMCCSHSPMMAEAPTRWRDQETLSFDLCVEHFKPVPAAPKPVVYRDDGTCWDEDFESL